MVFQLSQQIVKFVIKEVNFKKRLTTGEKHSGI